MGCSSYLFKQSLTCRKNGRFLAEKEGQEARPSISVQPSEVTHGMSAVVKGEIVFSGGKLIGTSEVSQLLFEEMRRIASYDVATLLEGETGTGKTVIAEAMHLMSPRKDAPFVPVDCGALTPGLIEATFFGHTRGAFTGADCKLKGILREASGGTVFLDEIGELHLDLQPKLLSALESRYVRPLGADRTVPVSFRLITATNKDLRAEVEAGRFRHDLYHRIQTTRLRVPPLRERIADVALLAEWFTVQLSDAFRKAGTDCRVTSISPEAIRRLEQHHWPGNLRELQNTIARAIVAARSSQIQPEDLRLEPCRPRQDGPIPPFKRYKAELLESNEPSYFGRLMDCAGGNVSLAARLSGICRTHLRNKLTKHRIDDRRARR